jgi:predicted protein tyrosine phosphatase
LYIASLSTAQNKPFLHSLGITHILPVGFGFKATFPEDFTYLLLNDVADNPDACISRIFDQSNDFISRGLSSGKVLVHCQMGMSRSGAVAAAFLMKCQGMRLRDALRQLRERRPCIKPNKGFVQQLRAYEIIVFNDTPSVSPPSSPHSLSDAEPVSPLCSNRPPALQDVPHDGTMEGVPCHVPHEADRSRGKQHVAPVAQRRPHSADADDRHGRKGSGQRDGQDASVRQPTTPKPQISRKLLTARTPASQGKPQGTVSGLSPPRVRPNPMSPRAHLNACSPHRPRTPTSHGPASPSAPFCTPPGSPDTFLTPLNSPSSPPKGTYPVDSS